MMKGNTNKKKLKWAAATLFHVFMSGGEGGATNLLSVWGQMGHSCYGSVSTD